MTPERWQQVKAIFSQAAEIDLDVRPGYLDEACRDDADLRREVESLLAAHRVPNAILDQFAGDYLPEEGIGPQADRWIGKRVGAYELMALLGHGGMGEVFRARRADAHYEKEVAIKLVRSGYGTEFVLQRFKAERQILAGLDHPTIARLLDGGVTEDDVPYLVMELVDGQPIDSYCESRALSITLRLQLFRDVCAAVSYAHQHLVVHRDLKPGNILVTVDGSIKLLDFGVAKLLQDPSGAASNATRTGVLALTPAYASPEQILGLQITTASDVYSLGVLLFHLLTGRSPYRKELTSTQDAIKEVCENEALRPSTIATTLPRDLDDIALTALRKEPGKRYRSVEQLSEDVRRYLTGLPVTAHGDHIAYRAAKFARRHAVEIGAASLVLASLIGGVIAATHQAHLARIEKVRAERDFAQTHKLANSLIFELHDSIRDLPGATSARKLLVERALQYLDGLSKEVTADATLQRDLAAAYQRIGDVQGKPFAANLGDTAGALRSYETALQLREAVYAANRDSPADGLAFAQALRLHAEALSVTGRIQAAAEEARRSVAIMEPISRAHPRDHSTLEELCLAYTDLAGILGGNLNSANLQQQTAALAARKNQLAAARQLAALDASNHHFQSLEVVAEFTMGDQLLFVGQIREAAAYYRTGLAKLISLGGAAMAGRADIEHLHGAYMRLDSVQLWSGDARGALAYAQAALALSSRLSAEDAKDAYARLDVATDYANLADARAQLGAFRRARLDAAKAVELLGAMVASDPTNVEYRVTDGLTLYLAGEVARRSGGNADALRNFRSALAVFEKVRSEDPNNVDARLHVAAILVKVADTLATGANDKEAGNNYRSALMFAGADSPAELSEEARYAIASADLGLAGLEFRAADRPHLNLAAQRKSAAAACDRYARGARAWAAIREPSRMSPNGFYTVAPTLLQREALRCASATAVPGE